MKKANKGIKGVEKTTKNSIKIAKKRKKNNNNKDIAYKHYKQNGRRNGRKI
mgnify:CR=1 FL=1